MQNTEYVAMLKDPRWQKKRLKILERDNWTCQRCRDNESTLVVHHRFYIPGREPWEYPDILLISLCEKCHDIEGQKNPQMQQLLLDVLARKFWADDIEKIASGFYHLVLFRTSEVTAQVIEWVLADRDIQCELVARFFEISGKKNKKKAVFCGMDRISSKSTRSQKN